jgi:hypothetical protein
VGSSPNTRLGCHRWKVEPSLAWLLANRRLTSAMSAAPTSCSLPVCGLRVDLRWQARALSSSPAGMAGQAGPAVRAFGQPRFHLRLGSSAMACDRPAGRRVAAAPHPCRCPPPLQLGPPTPWRGRASAAQRAQILELAERFYARRRQPTVVQVSPAELHGRLDRELAARGYRRQAPTLVLTTPIQRLPVSAPTTPTLAVSVTDTATSQWLAAWTAIEARPDAAATTSSSLPGSVPRPATSPRPATGTCSASGCWWSSAAGQGCSAWPPVPRLQPSHHYHYRVAIP